jgi:hypothetical protein
MAKARLSLRLEMEPDEAERQLRRAVSELGWAVESSGPGKLEGNEDAVGLCCREQPGKVAIRLDPAGGGTEARLVVSVPGFGPISSRNLDRRVRALARHLPRGQASRRAG